MKSIRVWHSLLSWYLVSLPVMWHFKLHSQPDNLHLSVFLLFCTINTLLFYIGLGNLLNSGKFGERATNIIQVVTFPLIFIPLMFFLLRWQDMLVEQVLRDLGAQIMFDSGLKFDSWKPGLGY